MAAAGILEGHGPDDWQNYIDDHGYTTCAGCGERTHCEDGVVGYYMTIQGLRCYGIYCCEECNQQQDGYDWTEYEYMQTQRLADQAVEAVW